MKVAHICAPQWIDHFGDSLTYRMALAHWIKEYPDYAKWLGNRPIPAYLIMDNGAFEGQQQPDSELAFAASRIDADEIVLPDVPGDGAATLKKSWVAYHKMSGYRVMFVPQGNTVDEWKRCLDSWIGNWKAGYLAIGVASLREKDGTPIFESKTETLKYAASLNLPIHLLGMTTPGYFANELLPLAKEHHIRGIDTSTAFALGARGVLLTVKAPKIRLGEPKEYQALKMNARRLIRLNMAILDSWMNIVPSKLGVPNRVIRHTASRWLKYWQEDYATLDTVMRACGLSGKFILEEGCIRPYEDSVHTGEVIEV